MAMASAKIDMSHVADVDIAMRSGSARRCSERAAVARLSEYALREEAKFDEPR